METEDMVRGALRSEADGLAVGDWSAGAVQVHVRRQRRGRRVALGVSAVAAALVVVGGTGVALSARDGVRAVAAASQPLTPPAGPAPEAVVVEPGRQLPLGRENWWMRLNDQEVCIHDEPAYKTGPGCAGHSWAGDATEITMQYYGLPPQRQEGFYNLLYTGPGLVASMAIEVDGQAHWVTVARLPGSPGFASGFFWGPALKDSGTPSEYPTGGVRFAAYDAEGKVLASKTLGS